MRTLFAVAFLSMALQVGAQTHKTKNVVVVLMDGYRWKEIFEGADTTIWDNRKWAPQDSAFRAQYWSDDVSVRRAKLMPFVWSTMVKNGQLYGNRNLGNNVNVRNKYWFSYPGRSETFCGYYDSLVNSNNYPDNPNENVLEFINKQPGYQGKVVTFASWDAVARIINRDRNGMLINIYEEDVKGKNLTPVQQELNAMQHNMPDVFGQGERLDMMTFYMAQAYIQNNHPKVVYLDFGDTDDYAHMGKYGQYLDAAHKSDRMLSELWSYLQSDPFYKDQTTLMVVCDHGRGYGDRWTSHGSSNPHSNETYLLIMGPDTPAKGEMNNQVQIYQDQYAETIAELLGFHFTANHPVGEPIQGTR